jgi:hypothetical protein
MSQPNNPKFSYMCRTDWVYEVERASDGNRVFPSLECLRKAYPCVDDNGTGPDDGCGWVKVELRLVEEG